MKEQRLYLFTGLATYLALIILAVIFYKERTIFIDIAYHLFEIIRTKTFTIQNNRFGAFFTQIFPLTASTLGVSLKGVALSYSVGFVVFYLSVFLLCFLAFKQIELALTMLLFSLLMVGNTFYWIQSEYPQSLAFTFLFFAIFRWQYLKDTNAFFAEPLLGIMVFMLVFFHPLLGITYIFITAFYLLSQPTQRFKKALFSYLTVFLGITILKSLFFKTQYESNAMEGIKNFRKLFPDYFTLESNAKFLELVITDYYLLPVFLALICVFYFRRRTFLKLFLTLSFFFGYLLMVNVSYPTGADLFYIENLYLPLSIFLIIPFVYDVLPAIPKKPALTGLLILISLQIFHIYRTHGKYTNRLEWARNFMQQTTKSGQTKILVPDRKAPKDTVFMTWATPYEFWLLSTIETSKTRSIVILENPEELQWALPGKKQFITKWGTFDYEKLPARYFNLQDTTNYQILSN